MKLMRSCATSLHTSFFNDDDDTSINLQAIRRNCPLDHTRPLLYKIPRHDHSRLDRLPTELLDVILHSLDIQTLTSLRSLDRRAKLVIDNVPAYRDLVKQAPDALRAMLSTQTASYHTLHELTLALRTPECSLCPQYAFYLFLPDCRRCCLS